MPHKVVALVSNECGHCDKFKTECENDAALKAEISLCEKGDTSCLYENVPRELSGYPTFKCIKNPSIVMVGYGDISAVRDFVKKCN
jgi:hypothetical protein